MDESYLQAIWTLVVHIGPGIQECWPSKACGRHPLKNLKWYGLPK